MPAQVSVEDELAARRLTGLLDYVEALVKLDLPSITKMGAHPLVPFLAQMQIQRLRTHR